MSLSGYLVRNPEASNTVWSNIANFGSQYLFGFLRWLDHSVYHLALTDRVIEWSLWFIFFMLFLSFVVGFIFFVRK